jgi:nucleosome binding factor SPN SPT16 subunit
MPTDQEEESQELEDALQQLKIMGEDRNEYWNQVNQVVILTGIDGKYE